MPCYYPIRAWYGKNTSKKTGNRSLVFTATEGHSDREVFVPCGKCIGCRLERTRDWAIRIMHEAQMFDDNCFITLTYDDESLPPLNSLRVSDFQAFMKKFRKAVKPTKIRFLHCGEYGENGQRPHYHAAIFNYDFYDKEEAYIQGRKTYVSESLQELWSKGFSTVDELNYKTARYIAKYVVKKVTGSPAKEHYKGRKPEYVTMSRSKGLGFTWFQKYTNDIYPCDSVSIDGKVVGKPPIYYDRLLEQQNPELWTRVKQERREYAYENNEIGTRRLVQKGVYAQKNYEHFNKNKKERL